MISPYQAAEEWKRRILLLKDRLITATQQRDRFSAEIVRLHEQIQQLSTLTIKDVHSSLCFVQGGHDWENVEPFTQPDGQRWPMRRCKRCGKDQWLVPYSQGETPQWEDIP